MLRAMADNDLQSAPRIVVGGSERRTADRVAYEVDAELRVGTNIVHARTENVSASGVFLSVPSLLIVGSRVNVRFALPAGSFEADSTVVRLRPTGERGPGAVSYTHLTLPTNREV